MMKWKSSASAWHCLALLLAGVVSCEAASFETLHHFGLGAASSGLYTNADGEVANDLVLGSDGAIYGTANRGGANGRGTFFRLGTDGSVEALHAFTSDSTLGAGPGSLLLAADGAFYGVSQFDTSGEFFKISGYAPGATLVVSALHSFPILNGGSGNAEGARPNALVQGGDGFLYGTANGGGTTAGGTVFKLSMAGEMTTLRSLSFDDASGSTPLGRLAMGRDGNFYGTTSRGGAGTSGTCFKVTSAGVFTALHQFGTKFPSYPEGSVPEAGMVLGNDGSFYGTTPAGGKYNSGTVFKMTPAGVTTALYSFSKRDWDYLNNDGAEPAAALAKGPDGNFYGTTEYGGRGGHGTVFKITPTGAFTALYSFNAYSGSAGGYNANGPTESNLDGANPRCVLFVANNGDLYGTTRNGGQNGTGTIFRLSPNGTPTLEVDQPVSKALQSGASTLDLGTTAVGSTSSLVLTLKNKGTGLLGNLAARLTGTHASEFSVTAPGSGTLSAGASISITIAFNPTAMSDHEATLLIASNDPAQPSFSINLLGYATSNSAGYAVLRSFGHDVADNFGVALQATGKLAHTGSALYGVCFSGFGSAGNGGLYKINLDGSGFTKLYSFYGGDRNASRPWEGPLAVGNVLYGMTAHGGGGSTIGVHGPGVIYQINTDGSAFKLLHVFSKGTDGPASVGALTQVGSDFFGINHARYLDGETLFSIGKTGTGYKQFSKINGPQDGREQQGSLVTVGSVFYGATRYGGSEDAGALFKLNHDGTSYTHLHSFGTGTDGSSPAGGLTRSGSTLYGTTDSGGLYGDGTLFRIGTDGTGYEVIFNFNDTTAEQGSSPWGELLVSGSSLYGVCRFGGHYGYKGVLFQVQTDGSQYTVLHHFGDIADDGEGPSGGLTQVGATLYGVTFGGGINYQGFHGTVYRYNLTSHPALKVEQTVGFSMVSGSSMTDFGTQVVGATKSLTFTITNNGSADITGLAASMTGGTTVFTAQALGATSLLVGESTTLRVDFTPNVVGTHAATLSLTSNAVTTPTFDIGLVGSGSLAPASGTFVGLVDTGNGLISITLSTTGSFSGKLTLAGVAYALTGKFGTDGAFSGMAGKAPLQLPISLHLISSDGTGSESSLEVVGNVNGMPISSARPTYKSPQTALETGRYTLLFNASESSAAVPQGIGYATLNISKTGACSLSGKLAEGTAFTASRALINNSSGQPEFLLFNTSLYSSKGLLAGALTFANLSTSDCSGSLNWRKPLTSQGSYFKAGFTTSLQALGSRYIAPLKNQMALGFKAGPENGSLEISAGGLVSSLTKTVTLSPANTLLVLPPNDELVKLVVNPSTGSITGSFIHPVNLKSTTFSGLLYQKTPQASGYFLGPVVSGEGLSGALKIEAK